ncbi:hypothetical protein MWU75_04360 [Ornithinimicrobium sp. F0845]|uniref:hypothetical protein n=1 Tax=Ornithinimicrobium sp. F0845 TaxID=2926412 RepID=UPI001FF1C9E6|nr:hypothetical protein [Ornithinimicrobium sp. F0845]MCK0111367.1 hypothetical protein [Ornithinimicrobium sp. F0845]
MTQVLGLLLAMVLGMAGFGGCTSGEPPPLDPGPPAARIGTLLASWDEGSVPDLRDNPEFRLGSWLVTTETEMEQLLASEPLGPDRTALAGVDLEESVLVVGGYHACQERGTVWSDGSSVWFDPLVPPEREGIECAWSPFTVDVFEVPRSYFGDEPSLVPPPWGDPS